MTEPPLLLGEAPSRGGDRFWRFPLSGRPARVLCELAGIAPQEEGSTYGRWTWALYEAFECENIFRRYAEAAPWSAPAAAKRAGRLELDGRVVVCLGRRPLKAVCDAYGFKPPEFHGWVRFDGECARCDGVHGFELVAIPHPSGLNRTLNDAAERDRCGVTLRAALDRAGRAVVV